MTAAGRPRPDGAVGMHAAEEFVGLSVCGAPFDVAELADAPHLLIS